jgi:hypothetical protein
LLAALHIGHHQPANSTRWSGRVAV